MNKYPEVYVAIQLVYDWELNDSSRKYVCLNLELCMYFKIYLNQNLLLRHSKIKFVVCNKI